MTARLESLGTPEVGEVVTLPGGLTASASPTQPGDMCELCESPIVDASCYLIACGGGWITVHAACLGECR